MYWANLLHLSYNMWGDWANPNAPSPYHNRKPYLRFDQGLWDDLLREMAAGGFNMLVIDLGDGVKYTSHPEIAVEGAWSVGKLREELKKARGMGLEPIPKLNFSTCHDTWLGPYARMVSTPKYYEVCADLIREVSELFDRPRLFHLGMDEENASIQRYYEYLVIRQHDLWWRDLKFLAAEVERAGGRPWIWSDYVWANHDAFYERMPRSVLQSNWYYRTEFAPDLPRVKDYIELDRAGFEQVPTVSNWNSAESIGLAVDFCVKHVPRERLLGFLLTPWRPTLPETRTRHMEAIRAMAAAKAKVGG